MREVLVYRLGCLSLPRESVVRLTDHPDMILDVYRGRKTTTQQQQQPSVLQRVTIQILICFFDGCRFSNEVYSSRKDFALIVVVLLLYVHCKQLWSCQDCQLIPGQA